MKKNVRQIGALCIAALCALPLFTGCQSDGYYQDKAVQRAREFLLEEMPEMPIEEQEYVKFNRPFFLVSQVSQNLDTGLSEICISWMVPNNPDVYMVFGVSGHRMIDWTPKRVIRKNFNEPKDPYRAAAGTAAEYVLQNMFGLLSVQSANHVRYTMPGVWKCTFPLDSNPEFTLDAEALAKAVEMPRYALAWKIEENGEPRYVVRVGTAQDDDLTGFTPYFAAILSEADFQAGTPEGKPVLEPFGKLPEVVPAEAKPVEANEAAK